MVRQAAHVIVVGNEKGGSGKSTTAFHLAIYLLYQGYKVASIDVDSRQQTLTHYVRNRRDWARQRGLSLPHTTHFHLPLARGDSLKENNRVEFDLFRQAMLIGGEWVQADGGATLEVHNPATGELVGRVPDGGRRETARAIAAAEKALASWRAALPKERSAILRRLFELMHRHIDDLAVFNRALTDLEVKRLYELPHGVRELR